MTATLDKRDEPEGVDLAKKDDDFVVPEFEQGPVVGGGQGPLFDSSTRELRKTVPTPRQGYGQGGIGGGAGSFWSSFRAGDTPLVAGGERVAPDRTAGATLLDKDFDGERKKPRKSLKVAMKETWEASDPRKVAGPKAPIMIFAAMSALDGIDDKVLGLLAPELRVEFGVSAGSLIIMEKLLGVSDQFTGIWFAHLTDKVKKRVWLLRISQFGNQTGSLLKPFATNMTMFTLMGMVPAQFGRVGGSSRYTLMADWYPSRDRPRIIAFERLSGQLMALPMPLIAGIAFTTLGWRAATFIFALLATGVSFLTFLLKEPVRGGVDRLEFGATREVAMKAQKPPGFVESARAVWNIKTQRRNLYATILATFGGPLNTIINLALASDFQMDAFQRSMLQVVTQVGGMITMLFAAGIGGKLLVRRPGDYIVFTSAMGFVQFPMMLIQAFAPNPLIMIVPNLFMGLIGMALAPVGMTIGLLATPARSRAMGGSLMAPISIITTPIGVKLGTMAETIGFQRGILLFAPFKLAENLVRLSTATTIEADIRAARAAAMAADEHEASVKEGNEKILLCRDVDVAYDRVPTVFNVDLEVRRGEIVGVLGTNGAGKSTLLKAVAGLMVADNGTIYYNGDEVTFLPTHQLARRGVVFVPGGHSVFPSLTVRENLVTATWLHRKDDEDMDQQIEAVLDWFPRLRERLNVPAGSMSGGEQQMLSLGQAFLMKPQLLIIDELSLGLAPTVVEQLLNILRQLREQGTTIIIVEQSLNLAATIADRAVYMMNGRIAFEGTIEDLLRQPDLVQAIFMGRGVATGATRGRASLFEDANRVLSCENLAKSYGGVTAVKDVSLDVRAGEVLGMIGPNGAGKTTLFDMLAGTTIPDFGAVLLDGKDVTTMPAHGRARRGLGRVFQRAQLFPALTVRETITVSLEKRAAKSALLSALWAPSVRSSEHRLRYRVDGYLELFELEGYAENFIRELSTGTRRAVEIACVMAAEPKVLLLDEPTSGLAQAEVDAMGPSLQQLAKETDCALVVIEHDLSFIASISHRMLAMDLGEVLALGTPSEVLNDPRVVDSHLAASADVLNRSGSRGLRELATDPDRRV